MGCFERTVVTTHTAILKLIQNKYNSLLQSLYKQMKPAVMEANNENSLMLYTTNVYVLEIVIHIYHCLLYTSRCV